MLSDDETPTNFASAALFSKDTHKKISSEEILYWRFGWNGTYEPTIWFASRTNVRCPLKHPLPSFPRAHTARPNSGATRSAAENQSSLFGPPCVRWNSLRVEERDAFCPEDS